VVETNDRLAAIVSHEVDTAAHAAASELREQSSIVAAEHVTAGHVTAGQVAAGQQRNRS
jgi:hypothetical protein